MSPWSGGHLLWEAEGAGLDGSWAPSWAEGLAQLPSQGRELGVACTEQEVKRESGEQSQQSHSMEPARLEMGNPGRLSQTTRHNPYKPGLMGERM